MNVFEDLIGELKAENLLEESILDLSGPSAFVQAPGEVSESVEVDDGQGEVLDLERNGDPIDDADEGSDETGSSQAANEYFRKRAMEEVSSLQMVEHVLSGVEREHMKIPAAPHDDLKVKKALHRFNQAVNDGDGDGQAEAEFLLLGETQCWHAALSARDKNISISNLRRFCENSRPVLSSQALMALARFYRNSAFTEDVRSKFDFVMTRLFSRDSDHERRKTLFERPEMISHIKTLYARWSSITYHDAEENTETIELSVQRFDDLVGHFETAETYDDLLNADVFNTIRQYKEECGELFFAPEITAAAMICNVRLGNKYVELIFKEKFGNGGGNLEEKYGFSNDQIASNAIGKTLLLSELLRSQPDDEVSVQRPIASETERPHISAAPNIVAGEPRRSKVAGVNKWLVATTVIVALVSGGIYFWADTFAGKDASVTVASEIDISGTDLKPKLRTLRVSNTTAYGVVEPSWDAMSDDEKKKLLTDVYQFVITKGMNRVTFLNHKGRSVGYASAERLDVYPSR